MQVDVIKESENCISWFLWIFSPRFFVQTIIFLLLSVLKNPNVVFCKSLIRSIFVVVIQFFPQFFVELVIYLLVMDNYTKTLLSSGNFIFIKTDKTGNLLHYSSAVLFCFISRIGGFVPFAKSAVFSHFKIGGFVSHTCDCSNKPGTVKVGAARKTQSIYWE